MGLTMPIKDCKINGGPGKKWGDQGKCYSYDPENEESKKSAIKKAIRQALAMGQGKMPYEGMSSLDDESLGIVAEQEALYASLSHQDKILWQLEANIINQAEKENKQLFSYISQKDRDSLKEADFAWPEKRKFPINSQAHVDSAAKLLGHAPKNKQASIKARIISIAKRKGYKLPESWE